MSVASTPWRRISPRRSPRFPDIRAAAASALGKIGELRAVRPLITHLSDEQTLVQTAAARALGAIGDNQAVIPLLEVARDTDRSLGVRRVAAKSLVLLGHAVETDSSGPNSLVYWALGLAFAGGAVALASAIGRFAVVPFLAGLGFLAVYYLKETRSAKREGYSLGDGGDPMCLDVGGGGDLGGGGVGGGGNGGG